MSTAIVTGAARGIGKAVADRLSADHDVLRVDLAPGEGIFVADVTDPEARARIVEAAGEVDVLVNNAGITRDARIVKMTEEQFLSVITVNLGAAYELTRARHASPTARRWSAWPRAPISAISGSSTTARPRAASSG